MEAPRPENPAFRYPPSEILTTLLRHVSRSFYLTLRVLPRAIRSPIGIAYLLARTSDTIADTAIVPVAQRLETLKSFREHILESNRKRLNLSQFAVAGGKETNAPGVRPPSAAEAALLGHVERITELLGTLTIADQVAVRDVLKVIISGQELDLQRFGSAAVGHIVALNSDEELDDYTYRVAGCVGEFWTRICRAHLFPNRQIHEERLFANAIRFGKGLQLINVLRDLSGDLRQGRCYMPANRLKELGLVPADLLQSENEARFRALYDSYLSMAHAHLAAGWDYTNMLPRGGLRLRLACAWPILIGARTLRKLRSERVLDGGPVKISRKEVKSVMLSSFMALAWPPAWDSLFARNSQ